MGSATCRTASTSPAASSAARRTATTSPASPSRLNFHDGLCSDSEVYPLKRITATLSGAPLRPRGRRLPRTAARSCGLAGAQRAARCARGHLERLQGADPWPRKVSHRCSFAARSGRACAAHRPRCLQERLQGYAMGLGRGSVGSSPHARSSVGRSIDRAPQYQSHTAIVERSGV